MSIRYSGEIECNAKIQELLDELLCNDEWVYTIKITEKREDGRLVHIKLETTNCEKEDKHE